MTIKPTTETPPGGATAEPPPAASVAVMQARIVRRKLIENSITVVVFCGIFAAFGIWLGEAFLNADGRLLDVHQNVPLLLLGLAALVTLIPGNFDLSIAGVATLSCFLTIGLTVQQGWPFPLVLVTVLVVGIGVGLINGLLIERLRVNSFIATLATGGVCGGLSAVYSGGTLISPLPAGPQLPDWFSSFASFGEKAPAWITVVGLVGAAVAVYFSLDRLRPVSVGNSQWVVTKVSILAVLIGVLIFAGLATWVAAISWFILLLIAIALAIWVLLQHTTFGRHLRAIGSNRAAALLAGVKVSKQVIKAFTLGGALASIAGITVAASQGSASPDNAASFLLPAFAAAFLSTVVLSDGKFTVPGTILGGVFVVWVGLALIIAGVSPTWIPVVNGLVLAGAVALSTVMRSRR